MVSNIYLYLMKIITLNESIYGCYLLFTVNKLRQYIINC